MLVSCLLFRLTQKFWNFQNLGTYQAFNHRTIVWSYAYWLSLVRPDGKIFGSWSWHTNHAVPTSNIMTSNQVFSCLTLPLSQQVYNIIHVHLLQPNVSCQAAIFFSNNALMKLKPIKKCVQPHSPLCKVFTSIIENNSNVKKASLSRLKSFCGKLSFRCTCSP